MFLDDVRSSTVRYGPLAYLGEETSSDCGRMEKIKNKKEKEIMIQITKKILKKTYNGFFRSQI